MRTLLSSLTLALVLVLSGCTDEFATDAARVSSSANSDSFPTIECGEIAIDGPASVTEGTTATFTASIEDETCVRPTWSVEGGAAIVSSVLYSVTVQADGSPGSFILTVHTATANGQPVSVSKTIPVTEITYPEVYEVAVGADPDGSGIKLDWSGAFPGCDLEGFRYSVRRLHVSGPDLPAELQNFDADGCTTTDPYLDLTTDTAATQIRYIVRTFRNGERVSTGQSGIARVEPATIF